MAEEGGTGAKPARGTRGPRVVPAARSVITPYRRLGLSCCVAERRTPPGENWCDAPPCGMWADTPNGSVELGLDEGFALVAELEGEEVAALVEGAEEDFVPFPQFLRQELALRKPN